VIIAATAWHVLSAALIFFAGLVLSLVFAKKIRLSQKHALVLYLWHTFFSMAYLLYSLSSVADSTLYYINSLTQAGGFKPGTLFVDFFTGIFTKTLGVSYLGAFLVYNAIGSIGLLSFASAVRTAVDGKSRHMRRLGWVVLLLPSVSFWSGAIGKDAISFMSACLFLWCVLELRRRMGWMVFAIISMLLVRPHMAALMVFAVAAGIIFTRGSSVPARILLGLVAAVGTVVVVPFALQFAGLGDVQAAVDVADYVEQRQGYNQEGGGAIDISRMSPPVQLFTYLYRPLPYEAHSATSLAASVENVGLIFLTVLAGWRLFRTHAGFFDFLKSNLVLMFYAGGSWVVLAMTTANLGIAARQKWMFAPILLYLALSVLGGVTRYNEKSRRRAIR